MRSVALERARYRLYAAVFALVLGASLASLWNDGDLSLGRRPWENLLRTVQDFSRPSFVDAWAGDRMLVYRSDDGTVLRTEDRHAVERQFLRGLGRAIWTTVKIAVLGTALAALVALPLALASARNLRAPGPVAAAARAGASVLRSIHTLVFGLIFVGIVGLGPMAGILAVAAHSAGSLAKLYAEAIEALDEASIEAVRATGASRAQTFFLSVWPAVLPQITSLNLYVLEFNIRDSAVLGLIGAGGLGLLISEATSLFQWGRLATILLALVLLVAAVDAASRRVRQDLL
jgi:phosphonate ABC transporter permease subunit PhnE